MQWLDIGAITQDQFVRAKEAAAAELGKDVKLGKILTAEEGMRAGSAEAIRGARMQWMTGAKPSTPNTTELDKKAEEQLKAMQAVAANTQAMAQSPVVVRVAGAF
jgi:hydroxymethylpyrimidine/phosphomethylpyrimidine kinase